MKGITPLAQPTVATTTATAAPQTTVAQPTPATTSNPASVAAHTATPSVVSASTATAPSTTATPTATRTKGDAPRVSLSGASLASILNQQVTHATEEGDSPAVNPLTAIDPMTEQKIALVRDKFIAKLGEESVRLSLAYDTMRIDGNRVIIEAESDVLEEEIKRTKSATLHLLAEMASINGTLDIEIVRPQREYRAPKPIRIEDRMAYLVEKNAVVKRLQKALELELE
ncbi:MAG: hypothetical protein II315_00295 [Rikenellaceae bacterium]|nr:hypothetical protein [Rikenellaceae bacterium]